MSTAQKKLDNFIEVMFIKHMPAWVRPNHFTFLRIILVPVVLYLIARQMFIWALISFVVAAILDALDGTLARKRKLITAMGQLLDPLADKALIFLSMLFLAFFYNFPGLLLVAASLEVAVVGLTAIIFLLSKKKQIVPANVFGKLKMLCQVLAVLGILFSLAFNWLFLSVITAGIVLISIILEIISFVSYETHIIRHS